MAPSDNFCYTGAILNFFVKNAKNENRLMSTALRGRYGGVTIIKAVWTEQCGNL